VLACVDPTGVSSAGVPAPVPAVLPALNANVGTARQRSNRSAPLTSSCWRRSAPHKPGRSLWRPLVAEREGGRHQNSRLKTSTPNASTMCIFSTPTTPDWGSVCVCVCAFASELRGLLAVVLYCVVLCCIVLPVYGSKLTHGACNAALCRWRWGGK